MEQFNLNKKTFVLVENSKVGKVNHDTIFEYKQTENLVTANYSGGTIKYGEILARLNGDELDMLYHCFTTDNELKAGKAKAKISYSEDGRIKLNLDWEWLTGEKTEGKSEYIETSH